MKASNCHIFSLRDGKMDYYELIHLQQIQRVKRETSLPKKWTKIFPMRGEKEVEEEDESEQISAVSSSIWERVSCYFSLQSQSICLSPPFRRHVSPSSPQISFFFFFYINSGQSLKNQVWTLSEVFQEIFHITPIGTAWYR